MLKSEQLVEKAAQTGERLLRDFTEMTQRYEFLREVRGRGLMIGIEFGPPRSLKLKASWHTLEVARTGLFSQLITIPLFKEHKLLSQVPSHAGHKIKLLPALVISDSDCDWILSGFDSVIPKTTASPVLYGCSEKLDRPCDASENVTITPARFEPMIRNVEDAV